MKKILFILSALSAVSPFSAVAATIPVYLLQSGDLIRGQSYTSVYYYGADGLRYVFPNDKTYSTWYNNFDNVKWLTDKDLATIQIGGNVTYKPGVKMVKINSDPKVYAISGGGILRPILSEAIAKALYGTNWNKQIDDVPDGFFSNYTIGGRIEFASQYSVGSEKKDAFDINENNNLMPATIVHVTEKGYEPPTVSVSSGQAVRFVNTGKTNQTVTEWDGKWGSGTLKPGQHYTRYFVEKGTWSYYSTYTPKANMGGALIVK